MSRFSLFKINADGKRFFETFLLFFILIFYFFHYIFIGHYAETSGVNYIRYFEIGMDRHLPFLSTFSFFYQMTYVIVPASLIAVIAMEKNNLLLVYRIALTVLISLSLHYLLFLLIPTSVTFYPGFGFYEGVQTLSPDRLTDKIALDVLLVTSAWNSFPAFHVGCSWISLRFVYEKSKIACAILFIFFIGMALGALTLKVHLVFDGIASLVICELIYQLFKSERTTKPIDQFVSSYSSTNALLSFYAVVLLSMMCLFTYHVMTIKPPVATKEAVEKFMKNNSHVLK